MGDRGNIVITEENGGKLFLYTHWQGSELPELVAKGLAAGRNRWDDEIYLNRILLGYLVGNEWAGETGFGLSTYQGDGGTEVYVSMADQTVTYEDETLSFEQFVEKYGESG